MRPALSRPKARAALMQELEEAVRRSSAQGVLYGQTVANVAVDDDPERTRARLESSIDGLDQTIKDLRTAVFALQRASAPGPNGLRGRLLEVVTDATEGLGFEPRLQFDGPIETLDDGIAEQLIPVLREALSNIAKHAAAHNVRVAVEVNDHTSLIVTDDGVGVPDQVLGGHGLANLAERAEALGGEFELTNQLVGGSKLTWRVPTD